VVQAARVSYGAATKIVNTDVGLLRYLMEHRHTTPFEMVEMKFLIRCPMDAWRQWIRHRTASVNEYSTRYSEAIDSKDKTEEWRAQATVNKQGSKGLIGDEWPEGVKCQLIPGNEDSDPYWEVTNGTRITRYADKPTPSEYLSDREADSHAFSDELYHERLVFGVAREQARKDLPLSTYTEAYWKIDLHNLIHFLGLRMDGHAQLEIRSFANAIGNIVKELYPNIWQAFEDFRMNAITFAGDEIAYMNTGVEPEFWSKRRASDFAVKMIKLGLNDKLHDLESN